MGIHSTAPSTDWFDAIFCVLGVLGLLSICKRLQVRRGNRIWLALLFTIPFLAIVEQVIPKDATWISHPTRDWIGNLYMMGYLAMMAGAMLFAIRNRVPAFQADRRKFLRVSSAAVCAAPAAALGFGFLTRKDFRINEFDLTIPGLPADLHGLRLLQLSDIHIGPFFTRDDLARVVDASNGLRADLAFITGDLITDKYDPLDDCLKELSRLRSASGIWGCMGNHEYFARLQRVTKQKAQALGMTFLRQEAQRLRFGGSTINLSGVDFQSGAPFLWHGDRYISEGDFNLLLAHTPQVFPEASDHRFDLILSGHTHGGQINMGVFGENLNIVDLRTPYTKGLYTRGNSRIYVNSGLGTIGVPVRLGAPAEITLIRLCKS